jgi:hypothetical protein
VLAIAKATEDHEGPVRVVEAVVKRACEGRRDRRRRQINHRYHGLNFGKRSLMK